MMKKWLIAGIVCMATLGANVVTMPAAFAAAPTAKEVEAAIDRGDMQGAQRMLDEVVAAHPDSARAHYLDAQVLEQNHRYSDALTHINEAQRLEPSLAFTDRSRFETVQKRIAAEASNGGNAAQGMRSQVQHGAMLAAPAAAVHHGPSAIAWIGLIIVLAAVVGLIMWSMRRRSAQDQTGSNDLHREQLKQATEMMDAVRAAKLDLKLSAAPEKQSWLSDAEEIEAQLRTLIDQLSSAQRSNATSPQADPAWQLEALAPRVERIKALAAGRPDPMQQPAADSRSAYADEAARMQGGNTPYGFGQNAQNAGPYGQPTQQGQPQVIVQQAPQSGGFGAGMGGLAAGVLLGEMMGGHRERDVIVEHDVERDRGTPAAPQQTSQNNDGGFDFGNGNGNDGWDNNAGQIDAGTDSSDGGDWDDNA